MKETEKNVKNFCFFQADLILRPPSMLLHSSGQSQSSICDACQWQPETMDEAPINYAQRVYERVYHQNCVIQSCLPLSGLVWNCLRSTSHTGVRITSNYAHIVIYTGTQHLQRISRMWWSLALTTKPSSIPTAVVYSIIHTRKKEQCKGTKS